MIRRPPNSTLVRSSAASDVYKRQALDIRKKLNQVLSLIYTSDLTLAKSLEIIEETIEMDPYITHFIDFCRNSTRGLSGRKRQSSNELVNASIDFKELVIPTSV